MAKHVFGLAEDLVHASDDPPGRLMGISGASRPPARSNVLGWKKPDGHLAMERRDQHALPRKRSRCEPIRD